MKEFDYEKAKAGAPVCTRDGRPARIICWDYEEYWRQEGDEKFPIIALVKFDKGERAFLYRENGTAADNKRDLMMAPVKHEGWVHIYNEFGSPFISYGEIYETKEEANAAPKTERFITVAKIEWEE